MKSIEIYYQNKESIFVSDDDETNIEEYSKKISEVLNKNNVTILNTTSESVILRPNLITAIVIKDVDTDKQLDPSKENDIETTTEIKEEKKHVDMITA